MFLNKKLMLTFQILTLVFDYIQILIIDKLIKNRKYFYLYDFEISNIRNSNFWYTIPIIIVLHPNTWLHKQPKVVCIYIYIYIYIYIKQ